MFFMVQDHLHRPEEEEELTRRLEKMGQRWLLQEWRHCCCWI